MGFNSGFKGLSLTCIMGGAKGGTEKNFKKMIKGVFVCTRDGRM